MRVNSGASATLVNCVLEGNSARTGGGIYVYGTATLYGCTFASNTAYYSSYGPDIYSRDGGTVAVYGNAVGFTSDCTQGTSLSTGGNSVSGTPFSFSGCTECAR